MKKLLLITIILSQIISCKKKTGVIKPSSDATICLIQKIQYDDGTYEKYSFDANKKLVSSILTYLDEDGIVNEVPLSYEYNSAGNLLKTKGSDGYTDSYIYDATGKLTRVVFTDDQNEIIEAFTVTMDSQNRLTKVISQNLELTGLYEYNGQENALSKVEVSYQGKVFDRYEVSAYETDKTKKSYDVPITGHPFDPSAFTNDMIYFPFNIKPSQGLATKGKVWTSYDENWENLTNNLRVYYDYTATRKFNSNNFVTERASNDAVTKQVFLKSYNYSNCN